MNAQQRWLAIYGIGLTVSTWPVGTATHIGLRPTYHYHANVTKATCESINKTHHGHTVVVVVVLYYIAYHVAEPVNIVSIWPS
jgi:hypothetical protein